MFDPFDIFLLVLGGLAFLFLIVMLVSVRGVPDFDFKGKTVFITGGSEGIGYSIADECVRRGAFVCIAARREDVLKDAVAKLSKEAVAPNRVAYVAMDVTSEPAVAASATKVREWLRSVKTTTASARGGGAQTPLINGQQSAAVGDADALLAPDLIICNAGYSYPARFIDTPASQGPGMMNVNFFGCVNVVRAFLQAMLDRSAGRIVLVSSMAADAPVAGFTLYGASKAAVRAFAKSLDMENACRGVRCQVAFPPDVQTPGFDTENKVKSPECARICHKEQSELWTAAAAAAAIVDNIEAYSFQINIGFEGKLLGVLTAGSDPATSFLRLLTEVMFGGLLRLVMAVISMSHYSIVKGVKFEEDARKSVAQQNARGSGSGR